MVLPTPLRLAVLALAVIAPAASAHAAAPRSPAPLVDVAPTSTAFRDAILTPAEAKRSALRAAPATTAYMAPDGQTVQVAFSPTYTAPDPAVAQTYVNFLGSLPHGAELSKLSMYIAPAAEVQSSCGGVDGTLACYTPSDHTMTVPGEQVDAGTGVTTSYVIAHEYGHHVATFRDNAPFPSIDFGPKYWASQEMVCLNAVGGKLAPGNEDQYYLLNPGEAWADTYAHLTYPDVGWQYTQLLKPDEAAFAAARKDVLTPWTAGVTKTFAGTFTPATGSTRTYTFSLTLDGAMSITLKGPKKTNYDLTLTSHGKVQARSTLANSQDKLAYPDGACRETPKEKVTLTVTRRHGSGPFTVKVAYAG